MGQRDTRRHWTLQLWRPLLAVTGLIIIIAWSGGFFHGKVPPGTVAQESGRPLDDKVQLFTVSKGVITPRIDIVGTVTSEEKIHLSARIPAYIQKIFVSAGDAVTKNQPLIILDDREIREQLKAAQSQFRLAHIEYKRTKDLFEKAATTEQALVAAESIYTSSRAQVEQVKVMLTYTEILSPITGVVTDRRMEVGDLANPGQVLLSVYDPLRMRLEAPVPVRLLEKLSINKEVEVTLERPDKTFNGVVTEIVSEIDPQSRTQLVKIHLKGVKDEVLPGIFGRLWVAEEPRTGIMVPVSSVYRVGQLELVQVVSNNRVKRRLVTTGTRIGDRIEILSGLRKGETILVKPQMKG